MNRPAVGEHPPDLVHQPHEREDRRLGRGAIEHPWHVFDEVESRDRAEVIVGERNRLEREVCRGEDDVGQDSSGRRSTP